MGRNSKKTQNGMMDRQAFQKSENYPTKETGLPEDRFQEEVQTSPASDTVTKGKGLLPNGAKATGSDSIVARTATVVKKKMSVKPTSDTELEESKIVGGVPLGDTAAVMSVAGALPIGISNDQSKVPYTRGGVRANERYGKKISTDNFIINNVVSEQIKPSFDEPKDVREAPDALQGYNGRKQFTSARGKKVYGSHPGSTLYERSVDFIDHSAVVSVTGQVIEGINESSNYPVFYGDNEDDVQITKGNYLLNALKFTIENGHITSIDVDETRIVVPDAAEAVDQANMNWQVDANNVAKAMVKMQTELGRETTDKWSPLGYVIDQPYQFGMLFHDGEAILGSLTGAAYKSAAHSLAFFQNKLPKEGVRGVASVAEWLKEDVAKAANPYVYDAYTSRDIFNVTEYAQGSAAALIAMFDSVAKYSSKADFLNQQRSFKFHLQTVDNNINPFHAKKTFYKALDKAFLFSTEDGNYNPTLPIHITNEVKVMTPYSMKAWLEGWANPHTTVTAGAQERHRFFNETGIRKSAAYEYADLRNRYVWEYVDPFLAGLCRWMLRHEAALVKAYGRANGPTEVTLPIHFTNTTANMFSFMVCSASQDMAWMRNVIFRDYLFAGEQGVYVWEDLDSLSDINPLYSSQYKYVDYGSALQLGSMAPATKIRLYWPEVIQLREGRYSDHVGSQDSVPAACYYLPFYFNENGINGEALSGIDVDSGGVMSYPLIRNGVNHEFNDLMYSMSERDVRLCLDRMVTVPVSTSYNEDTHTFTGHLTGNRYLYSSLRYDDNSDGRVIMTSTPDNTYEGLHEATYLATPRELGFLFPMPMDMHKPYYSETGEIIPKVVNAYITGARPESMFSYYATGSIATGTIIDRSASLSQTWIRCFADPFTINSNNAFVSTTGIIPTLSCFVDAVITEDGDDVEHEYVFANHNVFDIPAIYNLRTANIEDNTDASTSPTCGNNSVFSLARFMWSLIQRCYSPINVFDAAWLGIRDQGEELPLTDGVVVDPLEFGFYFGFAGCLASDFNQDILERLNIKDQLGMFYYEDEFIKSSLIFN